MNDFIKYLNGLHNYNAQNQNAYSEKGITSPYFSQTLVPIGIGQHIVNSIENNDPHIIILTGHAGDGKTSIMYQVLEHIGSSCEFTNPIIEATTASSKKVLCIKDFSELSDENRLSTLKEIINYPKSGKYVFMVSNTGPLIKTFGQLFEINEDSEQARMQLIDAMDSNKGEIIDIYGYPISVINVADIENSDFSEKFLDKVQDDALWSSCSQCEKREYCHIFRNHTLLKNNRERSYEFLRNYYIWQTEYGARLTIRSIVEQLAYMLTAGDECKDIIPEKPHKKLYPNLFFGYQGIISNPLADNILAVKLAKESKIYLRRLRIDEELLIRRDYLHLFGTNISEIINNTDQNIQMKQEWDNELRRFYVFMSIVSEDQHKKDIEDIFSKQFLPYVSIRSATSNPTKQQKDLVIDALRMIYMGSVIDHSNTIIPITMGTEDGITQSVQLIAGKLNTGDIELKKEPDHLLNAGRNNLVLRIKKSNPFVLTLPMMDHFEELRNGVIATNMDPQLSHGIENLKSMLLWLSDTDEDRLDILVMNNTGFISRPLSLDDGILRLQ